jgi:hypothetical protein
MNTYFIFYSETKEVIAFYQADAVDLDRYIVSQGPQVEHALAEEGVDPRNCVIEASEDGEWMAFSP